MNALKTVLLLGGLAGILMLIGGLIGGWEGAAVAMVIAIGINFFFYWFSHRIVLRMQQARPVSAGEMTQVVNAVRTLAKEAAVSGNQYDTGDNENQGPEICHTGIGKQKNETDGCQDTANNEKPVIPQSASIHGKESGSGGQNKYRPQHFHMPPAKDCAVEKQKADDHQDRSGHQEPHILPVIEISKPEGRSYGKRENWPEDIHTHTADIGNQQEKPESDK